MNPVPGTLPGGKSSEKQLAPAKENIAANDNEVYALGDNYLNIRLQAFKAYLLCPRHQAKQKLHYTSKYMLSLHD